MRSLGVLGVPTSAGAFAPGQERAPQALRDAGLVALLGEAGAEVTDLGDREGFRWRPDRERRDAQNLGAVVEIVKDTGARVGAALAEHDFALVLGGDCTVGLGTLLGAGRAGERGVVYLDVHADMNVPDPAGPGALDWTGMAHALGVDGAAPELVGVGGGGPLLEPRDLVVLAWDEKQATEAEKQRIEEADLTTIPLHEAQADPAAAASRALAALPHDRIVVHLDVDVIDFTDAPLSENSARYGGLTLDAAMQALPVLLADERVVAMTVTELNPLHGDEEGELVGRFAASLVRAIGA